MSKKNTPSVTVKTNESIESVKAPAAQPLEARTQLQDLREITDQKLKEACDRYLFDMDLESGPKAFEFPYIDSENGEIQLVPGIMEQEKITIGGHEYEIDAPLMLVLTKLRFDNGLAGETYMEGSIFGVPSPVSTTVKTRELYDFLNVLRKGIPKGTTKNLPTKYGNVEITAL